MSEKTAIRMGQVVTLAVAALAWGVGAWLLARTSVPSLDLSGVDQHRFFTEHAISRSAHYAHGIQALWLGRTLVVIAALVVLARRLPSSVRGMELGRIGSAIIVGMVVLVTIWAASLPFGIVELWWQHHWGLAPFDVLAWLNSQWATLGAEAVSAMLTIVLLVGLAGRFRRWWLLAGATVVAIAAAFTFFSGWLLSADTHPLRSPELRADVQRIERVEHLTGTPVRVEDVSSWTTQANAFTAGFGPSTNVVLWDTLLDERFTRGEEDVVIAHELGHVRSRHIVKGIGWSALLVLPTLWLLGLALRRRGGLGRPENLPYALLVLTLLALATAPFQNLVSRRYEAEADWRSLNATQDPGSTVKLFRTFQKTSLDQPSPPLWDYLWLETHPTTMQRIAMARRWAERRR